MKIVLADAVLAKDVLECLIEESDSRYGTDVKKLWTSTVRRCSEAKHQAVKGMCRYFVYSRAAYYKSLKMNERTTLSEAVIADPVRCECRVQPRLGGRKLDHILGADIRAAAAHFGRDRFFSLLRRNGLLVQRQPERFPGTNMDRE